MGEVSRARDTRLGRDVALKILPDERIRTGAAISPPAAKPLFANIRASHSNRPKCPDNTDLGNTSRTKN